MRMRSLPARGVAVALSPALALGLGLGLATAAAGLASGAPAPFHLAPQQKLLDRACDAAVPRVEKMLNEAWTGQILTVRTQVRVLRPGKLLGDIAFNPSGTNITVAGDASAAGTAEFGCGDAVAGGQSGSSSGSANMSEGVGIPKKHVVAVVRQTFTAPGHYTLTFTLNQRGRRILTRLGAQERAYRKHHPGGRRPPTITWGIGLHFMAGG